jgi:DNA replication and repair protein RecF
VQRNVALKQFAADRRFDNDLLAIYDEQLVSFGMPVYNTRKAFLEEFAGVFNANYNFICGGGAEHAIIEYKSQLDEGEFGALLLGSRDKDRINQYTTVGIHKDDIQFDLNGNAVKKFGSQGQQKSFIMSLKLAQFEYLYKVKKVKPLLLLDDLFDKLDDIRVKKILQMVSLGNFGQIFITHTDHTKLAAILDTTGTEYKIFDVQQGAVTA